MEESLEKTPPVQSLEDVFFDPGVKKIYYFLGEGETSGQQNPRAASRKPEGGALRPSISARVRPGFPEGSGGSEP